MMATVIEEQKTDAPADNAEAEKPRDYEAEARALGWVPKEDFKGDPARHVDEKTFVERGEEFMPIIKAQNRALKQELADLKKQMHRASEHFSKAEERAKQAAFKELEIRLDQATKNSDTAAARAVGADIAALAAETASSEKPASQVSPADLAQAWTGFREDNSWYDRGAMPNATETQLEARMYADLMIEKHVEKTKDMSPREYMDYIGGLVLDKFPDVKRQQRRSSPPNPVSGGGQRVAASARGKTFNDLPPEAQKACDKWVKSGLIKDREAYVKTYEW